MANVVTEDNINQGDFQLIMGLLANIDSLGETKPIYTEPNNKTYEGYK